MKRLLLLAIALVMFASCPAQTDVTWRRSTFQTGQDLLENKTFQVGLTGNRVRKLDFRVDQQTAPGNVNPDVSWNITRMSINRGLEVFNRFTNVINNPGLPSGVALGTSQFIGTIDPNFTNNSFANIWSYATSQSSFVGMNKVDRDWTQNIQSVVNRERTVSYVVRYNAQDRFYVAGAGWLYANGAWFGSDSIKKVQVRTIVGALDKVMRLRGVTYRWRTETICSGCNPDSVALNIDNNRTEIGLIAQEVERVVPEAVRTMPDSTKTVAYQNLVGLLVEAIKEQEIRIRVLEETICNCPNSGMMQQNNMQQGTNDAAQPSDNGFGMQTENVTYAILPNPNSGQFTLAFEPDSVSTRSITVQVRQPGGLVLGQPTVYLLPVNEVYVQLNYTNLIAGAYLLDVTVSGQTRTKPFIKQ